MHKDKWSHVVTFRSVEKAPDNFNSWTFCWLAPERDAEAEFEFVVENPDGSEYARYSLPPGPKGQVFRSDFCPGFCGGDPKDLWGQSIVIKFMVSKGKMRFLPWEFPGPQLDETLDGELVPLDTFELHKTPYFRFFQSDICPNHASFRDFDRCVDIEATMA